MSDKPDTVTVTLQCERIGDIKRHGNQLHVSVVMARDEAARLHERLVEGAAK